MKKKNIAILLATYNGERFLSDQLDSIISQTYSNWTLYVRDDGSSDSTTSILSKYQSLYSNIVCLKSDEIKLGAMKSFIWLMEKVDSDYYMFCDQDDIWVSNKIEISLYELLKLESKNPNEPLLVFSDLFVVNESMEIISDSMWEYTRISRLTDPKFLLVNKIATGCTMLFNNIAKQCTLPHKHTAQMHDYLIAICVYLNKGKIKQIETPLVFYRQHDKNTLGISEFISSNFLKINNIINILKENYMHYKCVNAINRFSFIKYLLIKFEAILKVRYNVNKNG